MGIGANDAANAFASSIGSKSLTVKQAVVLACIFESLGATLMGNHVVNTIRKGIADYECFNDEPYVFMYGCMWVCFSVGIWLFLSSKYEMPVSTTHSCVGGMIGMVLPKGFGVYHLVQINRHLSIYWRSLRNCSFLGHLTSILMFVIHNNVWMFTSWVFKRR